jgi:hypothetical protein
MEIVDLLNSGEVELFEYNDYYKEDKSLNNFEFYKISVSSPISYPSINEIDVLNHFISHLRSEIRNHIDNKIIKELSYSNEYEVLDLRNSGYRVGTDLCNYIAREEGYTNLISNSRICSNIQDGSPFVTLPFKNASLGTSYIVGSVSDKNIYSDPIARYSDVKIFLFNDIKINIADFKFSINNEATFNPRILIEIPISYSKIDSKLIYVRDDEQPDLPLELISRIRDKKIDDILDE